MRFHRRHNSEPHHITIHEYDGEKELLAVQEGF